MTNAVTITTEGSATSPRVVDGLSRANNHGTTCEGASESTDEDACECWRNPSSRWQPLLRKELSGQQWWEEPLRRWQRDEVVRLRRKCMMYMCL